MTAFNVDWVLQQLGEFIRLTDGKYEGNPEDEGVWWVSSGDEDQIKLQLPVVERIFDRLLPQWRLGDYSYDADDQHERMWGKHRDLALRVCAEVSREHEISENLGDGAPLLSAGQLHPWVWSGARSLWQSSHFREAVEAAIRKLNAETQNKLGRRDASETALFNQAFSDDPASSDKPRLRRMPNDGSKTFESVQRGARMFAEGVFAGVRNPLAHEVDQEMSEQQALEYPAALSVLARWVDESTVEVGS